MIRAQISVNPVTKLVGDNLYATVRVKNTGDETIEALRCEFRLGVGIAGIWRTLDNRFSFFLDPGAEDQLDMVGSVPNFEELFQGVPGEYAMDIWFQLTEYNSGDELFNFTQEGIVTVILPDTGEGSGLRGQIPSNVLKQVEKTLSSSFFTEPTQVRFWMRRQDIHLGKSMVFLAGGTIIRAGIGMDDVGQLIVDEGLHQRNITSVQDNTWYLVDWKVYQDNSPAWYEVTVYDAQMGELAYLSGDLDLPGTVDRVQFVVAFGRVSGNWADLDDVFVKKLSGQVLLDDDFNDGSMDGWNGDVGNFAVTPDAEGPG